MKPGEHGWRVPVGWDRDLPSFPADALHGQGVFETLKAISELVLKRLAAGSTA